MQQKELLWKTNLLLFSIYLCFFSFFTGCTGCRDDNAIPDPPEPQPDLPPISNSLAARIYFDATLSMQGFVVPNSTQYTQMCRYLESVIVSGWTNATVSFFRFGEQVEPIDRNTYLNLSRTGFYENNRIFRETFIQKIIEHEAQLTHDDVQESMSNEESTETETNQEETNNHGEKSPLVVIVTDLFQDNRDLTVLIRQLKEQYIQKGYEVGLLGLRSEFDGTVYDLGEAPLPYRSTPGNPESFRPFYLLVLGKYSDISHYFDRLIANGFTEAQTIIFSRYLVDPLLSFENATIDTLENLNRVSIAMESKHQVEEYRIVRKNRPSKISAKMNLKLRPHIMQFDFETLYDLINVKYSLNGIPDISQTAKNCLTVNSRLINNNDSNKLSIEFTLDSQSLPRKRIYLYEVTLRPEVDTFKEPDWCLDWDMGDGRNGAKTLNLVNFVRGLTQVTVRSYQPIIAKFHFYIEKR